MQSILATKCYLLKLNPICLRGLSKGGLAMRVHGKIGLTYHSGKMSKVCSERFHPEYCYSISITLLMTMESRAMKSELLCRHVITKWVAIHQRPENVKVRLLCHTFQHFCLHFVTRVWQFDLFFFLPKFGLKNQKHYCKFAQCKQRQKIIVGNQLVYSICLKRIPSLVTKCWCLCQSHKEVIESNVQVTLHI
jgi:hypothetical protein